MTLFAKASASILLCLAVAGPAAAQDKKRPDWTPGTTMIPNEWLMDYPCHEEEAPCSKIAPPPVQQVTFTAPINGDAERGQKIATNLRWGNCFACHNLPGGVQGGTVGPDLSRYGGQEPPLDYVYQRIWDVRFYNPDAHMPIYGTNRVLTDKDIRDVMAYLMTGK